MYSKTRVKICGITRQQDAIAAADLGVDAVGLVFYPHSPRNLTVAMATDIIKVVKPFVTVVGLFMDAEYAFVQEVISNVKLDLLQFHGNEASDFCNSFNRPYIKSIPMLENIDIAQYVARFPEASGFLLDAVKFGEAGGSGKSFDWAQTPNNLNKPIIMAGGLMAGNVVEAITATQCYAVDVSSGVETEPGIKSIEEMKAFVTAVKGVI